MSLRATVKKQDTIFAKLLKSIMQSPQCDSNLPNFLMVLHCSDPPPQNVPLYLMQPLANKSTFIKLSLLTQQIVKKQCLQSQIISKKPKLQHHLTGHQQLKQSFTTSLKKENNKKRAIKFITGISGYIRLILSTSLCSGQRKFQGRHLCVFMYMLPFT